LFGEYYFVLAQFDYGLVAISYPGVLQIW